MKRIAIALILFQLIGCAPYKLSEMHSNMATTLGQLHRRVSELHTQHDTLQPQPAPTSFYTKLGVGLGALSLVLTIIFEILNRIDIRKLKNITEIHNEWAKTKNLEIDDINGWAKTKNLEIDKIKRAVSDQAITIGTLQAKVSSLE